MVMGVLGGVGLILVGFILWWTTSAAASGRLGVNSAVGIRLPSTMRNQQTWRRAHEAALPGVRVIAAPLPSSGCSC